MVRKNVLLHLIKCIVEYDNETGKCIYYFCPVDRMLMQMAQSWQDGFPSMFHVGRPWQDRCIPVQSTEHLQMSMSRKCCVGNPLPNPSVFSFDCSPQWKFLCELPSARDCFETNAENVPFPRTVSSERSNCNNLLHELSLTAESFRIAECLKEAEHAANGQATDSDSPPEDLIHKLALACTTSYSSIKTLADYNNNEHLSAVAKYEAVAVRPREEERVKESELPQEVNTFVTIGRTDHRPLNLSTKTTVTVNHELKEAKRETLVTEIGSSKRRKQSTPKKTISRVDPKFRGVTMVIKTVLKKGKSQLTINSYFSR